MKTKYIKDNSKDNVAAAAVLTAALVAILGAIVNSTGARADRLAMQPMETIVVTAPRFETARMDTIVVTASRGINILVASK